MNNNYTRFAHIKDPKHKRVYESEGQLFYYIVGREGIRWEQCCWRTLGRPKEEVGITFKCSACKKVLLPKLKESIEDLIRKSA